MRNSADGMPDRGSPTGDGPPIACGATVRAGGRPWATRRRSCCSSRATRCGSISGVVTRQLENASGFEVALWRDVFTVLALLPLLAWLRWRRSPC